MARIRVAVGEWPGKRRRAAGNHNWVPSDRITIVFVAPWVNLHPGLEKPSIDPMQAAVHSFTILEQTDRTATGEVHPAVFRVNIFYIYAIALHRISRLVGGLRGGWGRWGRWRCSGSVRGGGGGLNWSWAGLIGRVRRIPGLSHQTCGGCD